MMSSDLNITIEQKIDELQKLVSQYDTESFAGFFAYFIKNRPDPSLDIDLNKFDSKLKDFLYLTALNAFSEKKGQERFEGINGELKILANKLNEIKNYNRDEISISNKSLIHQMAFRNHFDNGVLSYIEQDFERLRTVFAPFEEKIIQEFGFDIKFLIDVCKEIELISIIRFKHLRQFSQTREFADFMETNCLKKSFYDSFNLMPDAKQDAFLLFYQKPYTHLLFSPEDLYNRLEKAKVDKFLLLFACKPTPISKLIYYASANPFELTPILKISENTFLNLYGKQIPIAIYKQLYTYLNNDKSTKLKLGKHRDKRLERKVVEVFKSFFSNKETFFYENYFIEDNCEQDLMIIHKGTAIIIETKASKFREPFRDVDRAFSRISDDFKASIQYGFEQCKRVEDFFFEDSHFDIRSETGRVLYTVNPNRIHSVYTIVVTIERYGSLQSDLSFMLQKDEEIDYPWSVYIDDLEIFLLALKSSAKSPINKFFSFLKYRRSLHGRMYAIDELDICATFIQNPLEFKGYSEMSDTMITFSPYEQGDFDKLYFSGKLKFKEKALPDEFYKFGLM